MPLHGHACVSNPRPCPSALPTDKLQVRSNGTWRPLHPTPPSPTPPGTDIAAGLPFAPLLATRDSGWTGLILRLNCAEYQKSMSLNYPGVASPWHSWAA